MLPYLHLFFVVLSTWSGKGLYGLNDEEPSFITDYCIFVYHHAWIENGTLKHLRDYLTDKTQVYSHSSTVHILPFCQDP